MAQFERPSLDAVVDDGFTLSSKFNAAIAALYSCHAGANPPPAPEEGQVWANTSLITGTPKLVTFNLFAAGAWYPTGTLNLDTNTYSVTGGISSGGGNMSGPLLFAPGTAGAPGIAFVGSANTGVFRPAANQIGLATGGVQRALLTNTAFQLSEVQLSTFRTALANQIDIGTSDVRVRSIRFFTGSALRWTHTFADNAAESGANAGSNWNVFRHDDAGAQIGGTTFSMRRSDGNVGIGTPAIANLKVLVSADDTVLDSRAFRVQNANTAANASVNLEFATAAGALRGAVRGRRDGSTQNGVLELGGATNGVWTLGLRLEQDGDAVFTREITNPAITVGRNVGDGLVYTDSRFSGGTYVSDSLVFPNVGAASLSFQAFHIPGVAFGFNMNAPSGVLSFQAPNNIVRSTDNAAVAWNPPSDERLKKDMKPTPVDALTAVQSLEVVEFQWNYTGLPDGAFGRPEPSAHVNIGFVAQQIQKFAPDAVSARPMAGLEGGLYSVDNGALVPYLVRAIQQQSEIIAALESRLSALEGTTRV
jgi:hypothetical protein